MDARDDMMKILYTPRHFHVDAPLSSPQYIETLKENKVNIVIYHLLTMNYIDIFLI